MYSGALRQTQNSRIWGPGDGLALPVLGADRVEVGVDLVVGQAQQLRELAHHAEPILPLLEGALENFGAPEELVGHVPQYAQAPVQRHLGLDSIVHHLHGLLGHGPVPRGVVGVRLLGDLHDHGAVFGIAHLAQSCGDDVAVRLHLAQRVARFLAPQAVQRHGQEGLPLVGPAVPAPPADPHRHVSQVIGPLVSEEALPQLGHAVVAVRLQAAHQLLGAAPKVDVVVGTVAHELLVLVEAPGGRPATRELVVELTGSRRLPIGSAQEQLRDGHASAGSLER